jgi:hypothetical protein
MRLPDRARTTREPETGKHVSVSSVCHFLLR